MERLSAYLPFVYNELGVLAHVRWLAGEGGLHESEDLDHGGCLRLSRRHGHATNATKIRRGYTRSHAIVGFWCT
jgi:hypothetical protein